MVPASIVSERLVLTPLGVADADEMVVVLGDVRLHEFIGGQVLSLDELRRRYGRLSIGGPPDGSEAWLNWIVRLRADEVAVGTVQATLSSGDQGRAQIAWVVGVPWQGQGIASEAVCALVEWLDDRGVSAISAHIHPQHLASQKVAARAGLRVTTVLAREVVGGWGRFFGPAT